MSMFLISVNVLRSRWVMNMRVHGNGCFGDILCIRFHDYAFEQILSAPKIKSPVRGWLFRSFMRVDGFVGCVISWQSLQNLWINMIKRKSCNWNAFYWYPVAISFQSHHKLFAFHASTKMSPWKTSTDVKGVFYRINQNKYNQLWFEMCFSCVRRNDRIT